MNHTKGQVYPDGTVAYYKDAKAREMISTDYDSTASYAVGDYCMYDNVRYCCNTAIGSGGETWNSSHWDEAKVDEDISEIKQSLSNLGSLIKTSTVSITINSGSTTGSAQCKDASNIDVVRSRFIGTILCKNDDVYYNPITFSVYQSGLIEARAFTAPTANRTYQIIVRYF